MSILQNLRAIFQANAANEPTPVDKVTADLGSYSGYTREAALRRAAELASPQLLPAIAERLNDWVPQVRTLAQEVLLGMLASIGNDEALRLLPAVQRLHHAGRADHSAWIARFERALIEEAGAQAIVDGLLDPDVHLARACWRLAGAARLAPAEEVIARLLPATTDIVLARHAVEAIFKLDETARQPLFRRALASSFGMVRAIALRPLLAEESAENDALAIRMLTDLQSWVRLIAIPWQGCRRAPIWPGCDSNRHARTRSRSTSCAARTAACASSCCTWCGKMASTSIPARPWR